MTSHSKSLRLLLPLSFISIALISGELKANANEKPITSNGAALLGQPSIDVTQLQTLQIAQSTPSTPSEITPGRAVPGSTPSGTETNPANTTPNTTPSNSTPASPLSPTAPSNTTPITPQNPTPSIPQNTTPTTPETTTPDTTTPTTPGTTTPDTTTPLNIPTQELAPGRATRSGSSYVGVGGNIGIGDGDSSLGETSFSVFSKIGLTRNFSVRPSVLFSEDVAILIPVTYDFSFGEGPTGGLGFSAAPYLGVGAAISTGDEGDVSLLLTGGIDVPLSEQFTATAGVNATVTGQAAVGIQIGVGYNFAGF
jgi:hypothetical protein